MFTGGWPQNRLSEIGRLVLFLGMAAAAVTLLGAEHGGSGRIGSGLGSEAEEVTLGRMISDIVAGVDPLRAPGGGRAVDRLESAPGADEMAGELDPSEPATAGLRELASRLAAGQRSGPTRVGGRVVPPVDPGGDGPAGLPPADDGRDPGGLGSASPSESTTGTTRSGPGTNPAGPILTTTSATAPSGPAPGPTTVLTTTTTGPAPGPTTVLTTTTTSQPSAPTTTATTVVTIATTTTTDDDGGAACQLDVVKKANMREQPSSSATKVGKAPTAVYDVIERQGKWYRISADGTVGWVKSGSKQIPVGDC